jgi:hypothetical protein
MDFFLRINKTTETLWMTTERALEKCGRLAIFLTKYVRSPVNYGSNATRREGITSIQVHNRPQMLGCNKWSRMQTNLQWHAWNRQRMLMSVHHTISKIIIPSGEWWPILSVEMISHFVTCVLLEDDGPVTSVNWPWRRPPPRSVSRLSWKGYKKVNMKR